MQICSSWPMANLLFFSRVGFLFNLCYSAAMLFRLGIFQTESFPGFFIISSGYLPSFIMNMLLVTAYCIRLATNRNIQPVPVWLGVANSVFLLFQLADLFL